MGLYDRLFPLHARRRLDRLAAAIGRRALPMAAAAVGDRMLSMNLAEARGYVRARGRLAVVAEIDAISTAGQVVPRSLRDRLVEQALEQVVVRLVAQRIVDAPRTLPVRRAA